MSGGRFPPARPHLTVRLAVDATSLIGNRTGVGNVTASILDRLVRPGLDVSAFAVSHRGADAIELPPGVQRNRRPMAARPLRAMWSRMDHPVIEWWTGPIDVVWGPNFVVPPSRHAARVVTVHDLTCVHLPEMCTRDTLQVPTLLRRAIADGAWIHAVSNSVATDVIATFDADPHRVVVVPNGAPSRRDSETITRLAARGRALAGADRYLAFVGTLEPRKDLPTLVDAFDLLATDHPELGLVIAGPDGWGADAVTARIDRSPHRGRIVRTGWIDDGDRDALLAGATAFVYPSRLEGFGLPPLEAAAVDTPVVATRVGALPEVLDDAASWCEPDDVRSLVDAIVAVLEDPTRAAALVEAGRRRVAHHTWDATATGLVSLFEKAADER